MEKRTTNHSIAIGRAVIDHDPIKLLKHLNAQIGYNAGYVIRLSERDMKRITDCIAFHEGGQQ